VTTATSQALQEVWKGTVEETSLETTARKLAVTVQTWRGVVVRSRHGVEVGGGAAATGRARSPIVDNRVRRTISDDDDDAEQRQPRAVTFEDQW